MSDTGDAIKATVVFALDGVEWILNLFNDEAAFRLVATDVGLDPNKPMPMDKLGDARNASQVVKAHQFIINNQANFADIAEALSQLDDLLANLEAVIDAIQDEDIGRTSAESLHLLIQMFAAQTIRKNHPMLHALGMLGDAAWDAAETIPAFDLSRVFAYKLDSEQGAANRGRAMAFIAAIITYFYDRWVPPKIGENNEIERIPALDLFSSHHGWDLSPTLPEALNVTPHADSLLRRAFTIRYGEDDAFSLTILFVTKDHGGPGVVLTLGGELQTEQTIGGIKYTTNVISGGGASVFMPWGDSPHSARYSGAVQPSLAFTAKKAEQAGPPVLRIGSADQTRLELGELSTRLYLQANAVGGLMEFKKNKLALSLGDDGDGFLAAMSGGKSVDLKFGFGLGADTDRGFYLSGGTGLKVNLPMTTKIAGIFRIEGLAMAIKASKTEGMDISSELTGIFGLDLGPFKVSVEEMGLTLDLGFGSPPADPIDYPGLLLDTKGFRAGLAFKPPAGMGLFLDAKIIKGGGYLYFKPENNEYAGVLDLAFVKGVHLKAVGILTTEIEEGDGWALLLIISGEFSAVQLGFGFTLRGVGGILGLQHGVSTDKLQGGLRSGAMDHILFPPDPVKNAPQLLNTLRTVFPVTPRAFTIGPTVLLGWSTPPIILAKLGLLLQWNNVIQAQDGGADLAQLVLLGQLQVSIPPKEEIKKDGKAELVKLLVDVLGSYDFRDKRLAIDARLRNSHIAKLGVKGSLTIRAMFGDNPSMILAVGGFHPRFEDLPPGLPKQERMTIVLKRGPLKASCETYVAVTSNTFQIGIKVDINVKAGPVKAHGHLSFDALFEPGFYFEVDYDMGASVKFKGKTLAGVNVKGILSGPGHWTITGRGKVKVSIFKKRFSFNKSWGSSPAIRVVSVAVGALLREALVDPANWATQLPSGTDGLVTLSGTTSNGLLVHPWAQLEVRQKVAPLGINIDSFGQAVLSDGNRFEITSVRSGGELISTDPVQEHFARVMYRKNTSDRLRAPSFEKFDAGVKISSDDFVNSSAVQDVDCDFETVYLKEPEDADNERTIMRPDLAALLARYGKIASTNTGLQPGLTPNFKLQAHNYTLLDPDILTPTAGSINTNFSIADELSADSAAQVVFSADYEEVA